jgi:hypothetical protein
LPSERYHLLEEAVQVARQHQLDNTATFRWCSRFMGEIGMGPDVNLAQAFLNLKKEFTGLKNEELQGTV